MSELKETVLMVMMKAMSPDNPVSRLFEKVYGTSRLSVDVEVEQS